jgi:endoglucanase
MIMPAQATARRYVVQKSTAATLDFAAVTAQAARVLHAFRKQLPGLADSCLRASKKAWDWAEQHPAVEYNQPLMNGKFEPAVSTGAYGDKHFADEWLWAAAELHATTGQQKYRVVVEKHMSDQVGLPSWANVGMLGFYTLLRKGGTFSAPLEQRIVDMANSYIEKSAANAFGTVMGQSARDFNWGGNANAANQGILLVRAYLVSGDKKYIDHALTNFDYLLGRNATGYSFVTGAGCHPPMFPHHRLSIADGIAEPIPGLLVGGPNAAMQDNCDYPFTETETAYADVACSYASNEIAINWNAPLVYLTNALEALKEKVGYAGGAE